MSAGPARFRPGCARSGHHGPGRACVRRTPGTLTPGRRRGHPGRRTARGCSNGWTDDASGGRARAARRYPCAPGALRAVHREGARPLQPGLPLLLSVRGARPHLARPPVRRFARRPRPHRRPDRRARGRPRARRHRPRPARRRTPARRARPAGRPRRRGARTGAGRLRRSHHGADQRHPAHRTRRQHARPARHPHRHQPRRRARRPQHPAHRPRGPPLLARRLPGRPAPGRPPPRGVRGHPHRRGPGHRPGGDVRIPARPAPAGPGPPAAARQLVQPAAGPFRRDRSGAPHPVRRLAVHGLRPLVGGAPAGDPHPAVRGVLRPASRAARRDRIPRPGPGQRGRGRDGRLHRAGRLAEVRVRRRGRHRPRRLPPHLRRGAAPPGRGRPPGGGRRARRRLPRLPAADRVRGRPLRTPLPRR